MILLPSRKLPTNTLNELATFQALIDQESTFPKQVKEAKKLFKQKNVKTNSTFKEVKKALISMCSGPRRCAYCEDSVADEVEHFSPKNIYPSLTFVWSNLLYACGPCNGPKNNQFAVFSSSTGLFTNVTPAKTNRKPKPIPKPPIKGKAVLIHPRQENPLDYLMLDMRDTFFFVPIHDEATKEYERAIYTINILGLNSRSYLVEARENAFDNYSARLEVYKNRKETNASNIELNKLKTGILKEHHPTVWYEMKRQYQAHPSLKTLFDAIPEALNW